MKKQFFRVKQLADQTFLRAGRSEQLSTELQEADQKVEFFRGALTAVGKRLGTNNVQGQSAELNEKRLKKCMEYQLGLVMQEFGGKKDELDEGVLLKPVLTKCGKAEMDLARELADHEIKVEQMVSTPVHGVLETDIPNILKHKRNLSKLVLDKDSANNRYQTASKHGTKNEALKDEMEEAELKVEQCRDSLACEMFSLLRKESEFAQIMLQLVKLQRAYHESALHTLENLIPELEKEIGDSPVKAVFGCPLEEHLRLNRRQIALPLELCVCALWELGMTEEGLFRVAGGASKVRRMKLSIDSGCFSCPLQIEYRDVHVIASALKSYLRELPEPLLTYELYDDWIHAAKIPTEEHRLEAISNVIKRLPLANYDNLKYLMKFLAELSKNDKNKMTSSNIAIVIAPNLLWSYTEVCNGIDMTNATIVNSVVELLISNEERLFPGEFNAYYSLKRDELLPDLHEFDRPNIAHLRSSSNDTALITLDHDMHASFTNNTVSERHSPPQGSPKPVVRRKNKPAPIPPLAMPNKSESDKPPKPTYISGSSTINRATYRAAKTAHDSDINNARNKMSVSVGTEDLGFTAVRRKSLDFEHTTIQPSSNKPVQNSVQKKCETHINKSDISSPINIETTVNIDSLKSAEVSYTSLPPTNVHTIQSTNIHQITAQNATVGKIKVTSDNLQQKSNVNIPSYTNGKNVVKTTPVAAPRTFITEPSKNVKVNQNMTKSLNDSDLMEEEVQLRKPKEDTSDKPGKPVVPERPATLRPMSFRVPRPTGSDGELTMLERTHMYSVPDKQQVSIVQVAQNRLSGGTEKFKPGHDTQMAEKERFLGHQPDNLERVPMPRLSLENNRLLNDVNSNCTEGSNLVRTQSVGSRPERPPKPEHMKSLERIDIEPPNNNTSHLRTLSHGDIIDSVESDNTPSARSPVQQAPLSPRSGFARVPPQRPQPPPPPPPVRPKSDGESTDL